VQDGIHTRGDFVVRVVREGRGPPSYSVELPHPYCTTGLVLDYGDAAMLRRSLYDCVWLFEAKFPYLKTYDEVKRLEAVLQEALAPCAEKLHRARWKRTPTEKGD
jgi:hypothetical protein